MKKKFVIKNQDEYHDLYLKSSTLFWADVLENFRKICFENYQLDPENSFATPDQVDQQL